MGKSEPVPDHLRCHRTDGRKWRCNRPAMTDKKLCEIHHLQGRHRQHKEKVPESLKIQRKTFKKAKKRDNDVIEIRPMKRENVGVSEALDGALKKMKLKRGDLQLELIRVFLKRQVEKKKERELMKKSERETELMRELPYGLMEISPGKNLGNASNCCNVKLGFDTSAISTRRFRSKNIEPIPISTMQVVPFARDVAKLKKRKRKKCHWCRKISYCSLVKCLSCKREYFCTDCIAERSSVTEEQVKIECPVCRRTCSCRSCLNNQSKENTHKDLLSNEKKAEKIKRLQYLICMLLPVLKEVNLEQRTELELEAKSKGKTLSEVQLQPADSSNKMLYCCNNCQISIVDLHRSCVNCSYKLCLSCSGLFRGSLKAFLSKCRNRSNVCKSGVKVPKTKKTITSRQDFGSTLSPKWKACDDDGNIICPPTAFGGCGDGPLALRCVFPVSWIRELEANAEEIVRNCDFQEKVDDSSGCSICVGMENEGIKVSSRENLGDNFLYYPTAEDLRCKKHEHFQQHWGKGHPVRVCRVLKNMKYISWDPVVMFCTYLEKTSSRIHSNSEASKARSCLDWCELEICRRQIFMGSLEGQSHANMRDETLKLKLWLSSHLFQEQFQDHHAQIIRALPLQEYMNPESGLFNIAGNLPQDTDKFQLGPCLHISFGSPEDFVQADFVTKLFCDSHDVVNILVHTTDVPISAEQLTKIKTLLKKYNTQDQREPVRNTSDQKMENESEEKSSVLSGNSEESSLQNTIDEGLPLPNGVEEHDSESDSEPSIRWSGTILSSEESDDQIIFQNHTENSDCLEHNPVADSCGAQWDIFRRQDVPKLMEYLSRHSNEFSQTYGYPKNVKTPKKDWMCLVKVVHPILDQCFYLDAMHKIRLKEEFNIEPWTFKQYLGEAVIVPAGCPYQIRRLKSCVNIILDFISPENATECINLIDERRLLPPEHKARKKLMEVKKMTLNSICAAVEEIRNLS